MAYSAETRAACKYLETSLFEWLRAFGFEKFRRCTKRRINGFEHVIELINVASNGSSCPSFRLLALVFADDLMKSITIGHGEMPPFPIFQVEPQDLDWVSMGQAMKVPLTVCTHDEAEIALKTFISHCNGWYLPFFRECSTMEGVIHGLERGLCAVGKQAGGDAFLRILRGQGDKWVWGDPFETNLKRAGLDPNDYLYGMRRNKNERDLA